MRKKSVYFLPACRVVPIVMERGLCASEDQQQSEGSLEFFDNLEDYNW
jgi:hypothetical protein